MCLPPRTVKLNVPITFIAGVSATKPGITPETQKDKTPDPTAAVKKDAGNPAQVSPAAPLTPPTDSSAGPAVPNTAQPDSKTAGVPSALPIAVNSFGSNNIGSIWSFIWLAMTVGALSLLTPCVFPMVPITVSYFTNHASGNRSGAIRDAFIYALGIILTFTALGVALAVIFGAAGINKFASSPWVNLVITGIFFSFALSLFGAFNIQLPSGVMSKLDSASRSKESSKIIGLLLMGLTFSLTSFTCTAPFVGTLLVMAAQGKWIYPVVGMLAFSSVFALPFFILALAPQLVSQLPKSGGWLNSVKVVMGLLEIAAAMKFLSNVDLIWQWGIFTREVVLASWVAVTLLIVLYLLGKFQLAHDTPTERIGPLRLMIALVSLSLGFYLLTGLFGARLGEIESFLPPATLNTSSLVSTGGVGSQSGDLNWIMNDYDGALQKARTENKPVLIDFTGYTCTNCRWMEANMFTKDSVRQEMDKFIRVRLYTDGEGPVFEKQQAMQQEKFGTVALPFYAVVDGSGNILGGFPGLTRNESEFVGFLKSEQTKFAPATVSQNLERR